MFWKFLENLLRETPYWKLITMLNMSSIADFFSRNFLKMFRTVILKENILMYVTYFIKEHLWMRASDEETRQKSFGGNKLSSKLTLKIKWCHSHGYCDDSQSCEQLKKHVTDKYFERKVRLWTLNTFRYRKPMLALQHLSNWRLYGISVWHKFRRKNITNWVIIWIKFKVLWLI